MTSPDMIWQKCGSCERQFTLADIEKSGECPHCNDRTQDTGGSR